MLYNRCMYLASTSVSMKQRLGEKDDTVMLPEKNFHKAFQFAPPDKNLNSGSLLQILVRQLTDM